MPPVSTISPARHGTPTFRRPAPAANNVIMEIWPTGGPNLHDHESQPAGLWGCCGLRGCWATGCWGYGGGSAGCGGCGVAGRRGVAGLWVAWPGLAVREGHAADD